MKIKNALVFQENGKFGNEDISIENGRFSLDSSGETIDAKGCYAIPGLIDLHFHGCVHHDFSEATISEMNEMAEYQASNGITAICPATMTLPEETLAIACKRMTQCGSHSGAELVGINLEGPFLSPLKLGAQNPEYVHKPDFEMFNRLKNASGGRVKLVSVAPETEGALDFIRKVSQEAVCSIAHTLADYDTAMQAFACGARQVTHLFNAMPPFMHRAPGVIGAAFDTAECMVEMICDGVHIHPAAVRAAFQMFGDDRIILISDSMMAAGLEDGEYSLGGQPVNVQGNLAQLKEKNTIAGSVSNLMDCLRMAVQTMCIPLTSAVKCASINPAKTLGIYNERGSIKEGKVADLVLLDESLKIRQVYLRGQLIVG